MTLENLQREEKIRQAIERLALWTDDVGRIAREELTARLVALRGPTTLDMSAPGFLTITDRHGRRQFREPGIDGMSDALVLFQLGVNAGHAVHASDLVDPSPTAGATLRQRIKRVALWFETVACCDDLARALRRPVLSITDAGEIAFNPPPDLIVLRL
jgi:hypothetical protein